MSSPSRSPERPRANTPSRRQQRTASPTKTTTAATNNGSTPRRALSAEPPSTTGRMSIRTPGSQQGNTAFRASRQGGNLSASGRKGAGMGNAATQNTPHGRAAIRLLDSRRAAINTINTPGRNRRRSMRDQRETPRDFLRALSKTLAPKSRPIASSSSSPASTTTSSAQRRGGRRSTYRGGIREGADDSSDDIPIDRPRLSLPIDEDDSDGDLRPPRTSGLEDLEENFTMQSIEMPRRAISEQPRYSMRMSDYGGGMNDPGSDEDAGIDSAFFPRQWDDNAVIAEEEDEDGYDRFAGEAARRETMLAGRYSDFGAIDIPNMDGDQSTFMLAPQMESSPVRGSSPMNEPFGYDDEPDDEPLPDETVDVERAAEQEAENDNDDVEMGDLDIEEAVTAKRAPRSAARKKKPGKKVSKHGIEYPSLPQGVVKRLAQRFAGKTKIGPDTMTAIMQASDWFFEQLGDDLQAFAKHAGRKTIDESDMAALMRRQRQTGSSATPFSLAQRHLPRELLQELRMAPPPPVKTKRRLKPIVEDEGEDVT